jgi:hypothetical protein
MTTITLSGIPELKDKLRQVDNDLSGGPAVEAMHKATMLVTGSAKVYAPVDRGVLRASIMPDVVTMNKTVEGVVGSNVIYAAAQELGTKPFWPPLQPLVEWVKRKGMASGAAIYAVAKGVQRAIARRGIKAKLFLKRGLDENRERILQIFDDMVTKVVEK